MTYFSDNLTGYHELRRILRDRSEALVAENVSRAFLEFEWALRLLSLRLGNNPFQYQLVPGMERWGYQALAWGLQ